MTTNIHFLAIVILAAAACFNTTSCTMIPEAMLDLKNYDNSFIAVDSSINHHKLEESDVYDSQREVLELQENLENFVQHIQSFISETEFEVEEFISEANIIEKQLLKLTASAKKLEPDSIIERMLQFAACMFQIMVETTENLKHYDLLGTMDQHLLICMFELNVRLLALFDRNGLPNFNLVRYKERMKHLNALMEFWSQEFEILSDVPIGIRRVFHAQKMSARQKLDLLKGSDENEYEYFEY